MSAAPGHAVHYRDVEPTVADGVATHVVHSPTDDSGLELSVVVAEPGSGAERTVADGFDEVLYVMSGSGSLTTGGVEHPLTVDTGGLAHGGQTYRLTAGGTDPLEVVVVSGRHAPGGTPEAPTVHTVDATDLEREAAVSHREFQIVVDPRNGCSGMTQFVGYVPAIRTKRHIHPYDEMLCVLRGEGTVEIEGREVEIGPGWCYYLPRGCVHLVQNTQEAFLVELGVFTPAGSPAQNTPVE